MRVPTLTPGRYRTLVASRNYTEYTQSSHSQSSLGYILPVIQYIYIFNIDWHIVHTCKPTASHHSCIPMQRTHASLAWAQVPRRCIAQAQPTAVA